MAATTLVDRAGLTLRNFAQDPDMAWFRDHLKESKGILIVPRLRQAGFIIGGAGGNGVVLLHEGHSAAWTGPAFFTLHLAPSETQASAEATELVLLVMSDKGRDALLNNKLQLGKDVSLAVGPLGAGVLPVTADLLQFARSNGSFGSSVLMGSVLAVRDTFNEGYYGKTASLSDILVKRTPSSRQALSLRKTLDSIR